jgi:hypothetical protein
MSVNSVFALGAVLVASTGIIFRAYKHPEAEGTLKTSATPNNSVSNSTAISPKFKAEAKRGLGVVLAA